MVLNTKDIIRNQNSSGRKPGGHQKHKHSSSNIRQAQPSKKPFLKRNSKRSKPGTLSSGKESQGQSSTYPTPSQKHSKKPKENSKGKPYWKNK